mmetsp:Transcript_56229/g.176592  ORF Transcript_56229/g.176592 Transcript_56229/m.176592 type:complete len:263 (-) Transcript_56229:219-1007(-)
MTRLPKETCPGKKTRHTPWTSTSPPRASMRRCSSGRFGLWSSERRMAVSCSALFPEVARQITARESPTFAMRSLQEPAGRCPRGASSGKTRPRIMVDPSINSCCLAFARNSSSARAHASTTARRRHSSASEGCAARRACRWMGRRSARWSTQRLPQWPSRTQNPTTTCPAAERSSMSKMCRSSCISLPPCQQATPRSSASLPTCASREVGFLAVCCWQRLCSSASCACASSPKRFLSWASRVVRAGTSPPAAASSWSCCRRA